MIPVIKTLDSETQLCITTNSPASLKSAGNPAEYATRLGLSMSQMIFILIITGFVALFGCALVFLTTRTGPKLQQSAVKKSTYECGLVAQSTGKTQMPVKFYLTAILFILFDIEIIFMYPWAVNFTDFIQSGYGAYVLSGMGFFLFLFVFGLFWEVKSKALEWD